jgi:hypothetical protein
MLHISNVNLKRSTNLSKCLDGLTSVAQSVKVRLYSRSASRKRCELKRLIDFPRLFDERQGSKMFTNFRLGVVLLGEFMIANAS